MTSARVRTRCTYYLTRPAALPLISLASVAGPRICNLVGTIGTARILSIDDFTSLSALVAIQLLITPLLVTGLDTASLVRFATTTTNPERSSLLTAILTLFALSTIAVSILFTALSPSLPTPTIVNHTYTPLLLLVSFTGSLATLLACVLQGNMLFTTHALYSTITALLGLFATLFGASIGGASGVLLAWIMQSVAYSAIAYSALKRNGIVFQPQRFPSFGQVKSLLNTALPSLLASIAVGPTNTLALTVSLRHGTDVIAAIVRILLQWQSLAVFVQTALSTASVPVLARRLCRNNDTPSLSFVIVPGIAAGLLCALLLLSFPQSVLILYGPQYNTETAAQTLRYGALSLLFIAVTLPMGALLTALNRLWLASALNLGRALTQLFLTYLYIGDGAPGFGKALALSYCVHLLTSAIFSFIILMTRRYPQECVPS